MSQTPDRFHVTQDFILQNGPVFEAKNLKTCVNHVNLVAPTADTGNTWKKAFSLVMRGAEAALEQVGVESGVMKSLGGEPMTHILGETFYTQVPHLHGLHIPVSVDRSTSLGACQRVGNITPTLTQELQDTVKAKAGPWKYPRWIEFVDALPKTATGKIQRFKLRAPTVG